MSFGATKIIRLRMIFTVKGTCFLSSSAMGMVGEQKQVPPRAQFSASGALGLVGMTIPRDRNLQMQRLHSVAAPVRQSAA
jgi:hypothetical protein